ncbi:MAG: hypothetical protein JST52_10455, partial [Bacteroidetes bacterium]|nr:hypothetical protein [Bacteroidota bacterium]
MERSSIHILLAAVGFAWVSILYFFSLIMGLPVGATLVIWIVVIGVLYWQVFRFLPPANAPAESAVWSMLLMVVILIIGSWQLLRTLPVAEKYGAWDAWWFWNYHAKFLSRPDLWERAYTTGGKELLAARVSHSDYPLMLPSTVGFLWRLLQTTNNLIPFLVGLFFTLLIPLLLLSELARKNILFAGLVFWGLLHNPRYVDVGLTQNADIILAFALLSSFVSMYHYQKDRSRGTLFLWAAGMGMCLWVKNEGIALAVAFFMVYLPVIFRNRENWAALLGIVPFLAALLIFKIGYAPSNDIVSSLAPETLRKLSDGSRYRTVWIGFSD